MAVKPASGLPFRLPPLIFQLTPDRGAPMEEIHCVLDPLGPRAAIRVRDRDFVPGAGSAMPDLIAKAFSVAVEKPGHPSAMNAKV